MPIRPVPIASVDFASGVNNLLRQFDVAQRRQKENAEIERLAAQRAAVGENIPGALRGDQGALGALARADPRTALSVESLLTQRQRLNQAGRTKAPAGFTFNDPENPAAGMTPIPGFLEAKERLRKAGATKITNAPSFAAPTIGFPEGETAGQKRAGQKVADMAAKAFEAGADAQDQLVMVEQLPELLKQSGSGFVAGLLQFGGRFGLDFAEGASARQIVGSYIDKMTPSQRDGLPGAASERDVRMFKNALPSISRTAVANEVIIETFRALANTKVERAKIAESFMAGLMTRADLFKALRKVKDPFTRFKQWQKQKKGGPRPQTAPARTAPPAQSRPSTTGVPADVDPLDWQYMTPEERKEWQ